jgi:uncharacterized protein (TIRG00374 family)
MKKKFIRYAVGILVTTLALWLSFRNLNWSDLAESFSHVHISWVVLAVLNVLFTVYALGWRWQVLLESKQKFPMRYMFKLNIISQYLNIIVPGRFGEIAKAWLPAKQYGISGSYVLGTVVIEKIFDFFAWVILWVSVPAFFALRDRLKGYTIAVVICFVLILLLVLVVWKRELMRKWLVYFASLLPDKIRQRVLNFLERGMEAFSLLKKSRTSLIIVLYTALILILSTLTNFLLFKAYDFSLSFFEALILLLVIQVGSAPPSVPGKIGIFEYMVILGLTLFAVNKADAMSYALMLHMVSYLPKIILGFIFMTNLNISIKKTEAEASKFEGVTKIPADAEEVLPE